MEISKMSRTQKMTYTALTVALGVVLSRVAGLYLPFGKRISFASIPIFLCSLYLGPVYGLTAGALTDVIGAILFPIGPFNPLFTIAPAVSGSMPGIMSKTGKVTAIKIIIVCILQSIFTNTLNSYLFSILFAKKSFIAYLAQRLPFGVLMIVLKSLVLIPLVSRLNKAIKHK